MSDQNSQANQDPATSSTTTPKTDDHSTANPTTDPPATTTTTTAGPDSQANNDRIVQATNDDNSSSSRKQSIESADAEEASDSMSGLDVSKQKQIELEEEKKLKARHPCIQRPGSDFLQKRLQRGQKYFDSGDYNMAKAASTNPNVKLPTSGVTPMPAIDSKILNKRH